jgi:hypothetical protein
LNSERRDEQHRARWSELPLAIQDAARHNPVIHRIATEYACGNICFLDEALAQMVIALDRDWAAEQKQAFQAMMAALPLAVQP